MKRIIYFILLFFLCFQGVAQDLDKAYSYFENGEYAKAAAEFELLLSEIKDEYVTNNTGIYAEQLLYAAVSFERSLNIEKAVFYYTKSKAIYEYNNETSDELYLILIQNLADLYVDMGLYEKALSLRIESLNNFKATMAENDPELGVRLNNLAILYSLMGQHEEALDILFEALEYIDKSYEVKNPLFYVIQSNLVDVYLDLGRHIDAQPFFLDLIGHFRGVVEKNNPYYLTILANIGSFYRHSEEYAKSIEIYLELIAIMEKTIEKHHSPDYYSYQNNLALVYAKTGEYEKALSLYLNVLPNLERILGKDHHKYGSTLYNLALLYSEMGEHEKAISVSLEALDNAVISLGTTHPDYFVRLTGLAINYSNVGKYNEALTLYMKAKEIGELSLGRDHDEYIKFSSNLVMCLKELNIHDDALLLEFDELLENGNFSNLSRSSLANSLGLYYRKNGEYAKAMMFFQNAINYYIEDSLRIDQPGHYAIINNLAQLFADIGQYQIALRLSEKSLKNAEEIYGKRNPVYGIRANNLAGLYKNTGQYSKALLLYIEALANAEYNFGKITNEYANRLNNLAGLYVRMGMYNIALPKYQESVNITEKLNYTKNVTYVGRLANLSHLYFLMGKLDSALVYSKKAMGIFENINGKHHPYGEIILINKSKIHLLTGRRSDAFKNIQEANSIFTYNVEQNFQFLSEHEKEEYLKLYPGNFEFSQSFYSDFVYEYPSISQHSYNLALTTSGMILSSSTQMREAILGSENEELISQFNHWLTLKHQINHLLDQPISQRYLSIDSLSDVATSLERDLVRNSQEFATANSTFQIKWEDIRNNLNTEEAAVELISFDYHNGKQWTDSTFYCALILTREMEYPQMVFLFEERSLMNLLPGQYSSQSDYNLAYQGTRGSGTVFFDQPEYRGNQLYDLIWQPLDSILNDEIETIYFSPSGQLNSVSFAAIPTPDGKLLMEKYNLVQVTSTRTVAMPDQSKTMSDAFVFGGVDYNLAEDQRETLAQQQQADSSLVPSYQPYRSVQTRHSGFSYLAGSLDEANTISKMLSENYQTTTLTGLAATEERFKAMSGMESPSIIHIATHGFYLPDTIGDRQRDNFILTAMGEDRFRLSDDPLMRSALVLAGANHTWAGNPALNDMDDGILTAREVSSMNLSNTQLAVLSACQTGLGDVMGSEGVSGLQRAFMMAGVKSIIMSLWTVPDKETAEFMETFYTHWLGGIEIRAAFNTTQKQMNARYPNEPYKWAGFVLVE